jgi:transcriptional regulator with XRE-family HTH domain
MNMPAVSHSPYGGLLRHWRTARGLSQLALATEAGISTRHLSFLETGRAQPSRPMVELLAGMLDVPLDERNALLLAAGYAPAYERRPLGAPDLQPLQRALDFILKQQEPYPAIVVDGSWNIVKRNIAAQRIFGLFISDPPEGRIANTMRTMFHPRGLRQYVVNWEDLAVRMLYKVHRDAATGLNEDAVRLRQELMSYPGVPPLWKVVDVDRPAPALMTMRLKKGEWSLAFFSTISTLGVPCDVALQDLKVECFFPADCVTDDVARQLAADSLSLLQT